jgi:hypothetical protein
MHARPTTVRRIPCVSPCDSGLVILESNEIEASTMNGNEKILPKTGNANMTYSNHRSDRGTATGRYTIRNINVNMLPISPMSSKTLSLIRLLKTLNNMKTSIILFVKRNFF